MSGDDLAAAAQALAGCRFRLHGRDPATGLDCVGVLSAALSALGRPASLPSGYALRARDIQGLDALAAACGLSPAEGPIRPGDVMLLRISPCQFHLAIAVDEDRFVHAHARRRRVIVSAGPVTSPIAGRWRI